MKRLIMMGLALIQAAHSRSAWVQCMMAGSTKRQRQRQRQRQGQFGSQQSNRRARPNISNAFDFLLLPAVFLLALLILGVHPPFIHSNQPNTCLLFLTQYLPLLSVHRYENIITQRKNTDLRIRIKNWDRMCYLHWYSRPLNRIQDTK